MIPNNYSRITDWERKQKNSLIKGLFIFVLTEAAAALLILRILGVL